MSHPDNKLVSPEWVEDHLDEFQSDEPTYRLLEVNNPTVIDESEYTTYGEGHIPGAVFLDWNEDLSDPIERDILTKSAFEDVVGDAGIASDTTVVLYGDGFVPNWFALFAYWEFKYFGHEDVRVLDGGKPYWVDNDHPLTQEVPDFPAQDYSARGPFEGIRAYKDDVDQAIDSGIPLVDVRSPAEFTGELIAPEGLQETAQRGGHIPGARSVPTGTVLQENGKFKSPAELKEIYETKGVTDDQAVITYCRVGERSSIAWFVLHELLDYPDVENYDGSWTEWGNTIRAPIETGEEQY